jgi:hypothetical protein
LGRLLARRQRRRPRSRSHRSVRFGRLTTHRRAGHRSVQTWPQPRSFGEVWSKRDSEGHAGFQSICSTASELLGTDGSGSHGDE